MTTDSVYDPPATLATPIYNEDGFSVGFKVVHPPGVECAFHPEAKRCTCGRMDIGVVREDSS